MYKGSFGQEQRWQLGVPSTYKHPLAPRDTLVDKSNMSLLEERLLQVGNKVDEAATASRGTSGGGGDDRGGRDEELTVDSFVSMGGGEKERGDRERSTSVVDLSESESTTEVTVCVCEREREREKERECVCVCVSFFDVHIFLPLTPYSST